MTATEAVSRLRSQFPEAILAENSFREEITLDLKIESLVAICQFCRDELGFDYLIDVASLDHLGDEPRFEMVYEISSLASGVQLRLKAKVPEDNWEVPSLTGIWPTADWHEREVYDMMGIRFSGHPDLRRILMWEGYPFFPLRKDFPLQGKPSDQPDVAFTDAAPLAGGPFVTVPTDGTTQVREPRARRAGDEPPAGKFLAEP